MRRLLVLALAASATALAAAPARAGALRLRIPNAIAVSGDTIFLSHLLPATAPGRLRSAAASIPLGASPASGSARLLTSSEISSALSRAGVGPGARPLIPDVVTIRRAGVLLSAADLIPLLSSAVGSPVPLTALDISLSASILLPQPLPALRVLSVKPDPLLHATAVRIGPSTGSSVVPFDVMVRTRGTAPARNLIAAGYSVPRSSASVVDPKRMAVLTITTLASQLVLRVRPLERGDIGQTIRVRLPGSGKTFHATVTAVDCLEGHF